MTNRRNGTKPKIYKEKCESSVAKWEIIYRERINLWTFLYDYIFIMILFIQYNNVSVVEGAPAED